MSLSVTIISVAATPTVFSIQGSHFANDNSNRYTIEVLKLALDKTKKEYGDYEIKLQGHGLNVARVLKLLEKKFYVNHFSKMSITDDIIKKVHVIKFPIDRGIIGYRIAVIHPSNLNRFCKLNENSIKNNISIVQGIGWADSEILKANDYTVYSTVTTDYDKVFALIEKGRVDAFFRGISEPRDPYFEEMAKKYGLIYDQCIALAYELPRFFITNLDNIHNANRVELGLKRAYEDGSFIKLWQKYNIKNLANNNLIDRKIFRLINPLVKTLEPDYKKYNFSIEQYFLNAF